MLGFPLVRMDVVFMTVPCVLCLAQGAIRIHNIVFVADTSEQRCDQASPLYGAYHDSSVFDPEDAVCIEEFDEIGFLASCGVEAYYMRVRGDCRWRQ